MKHTIKGLIATLSFAFASVLSVSGCSLLKGLEKSCDVDFVGGTPFTTTHVTTFANGLTPTVDESEIPINHKFFGWTARDPETVHFADPNFKEEYVPYNGIVRYGQIENYIHNGRVTMRPLYINRDELPVYYLVVGWYSKTSTSGLGQSQIDRWTVDLHNYLRTDCGATDAQIALTVVRAYDGDVATMGGHVNADGDVDILIGVGNNINSTGGVAIIEKQGDIPMGGKSRYIARLTDRPVVNSVYTWLKTDAGHASLAQEEVKYETKKQITSLRVNS